MSKKKKQREKSSESKRFLATERQFLVDLECLREMHSSVIPLLNDKDAERKKCVHEIIKRVVVIEDEEEKVSDQPNEIDSTSNSEEVSKTTGSKGKDKKNKKFSINMSGTDTEVLLSNIGKLERAKDLFEKQVIVTLVSRFDEFIGKLLKLILEQNPSWLISSEKTITYKELIDLKSIDKAIEGVIHKEVENLLRDSHEEQIEYIDEKLKLGISDNFSKLPEFLEIAERRNLFVHTGGIVSQQYIDKCNSFGVDIEGVNHGTQLDSDMDYFSNAFMVYFEMGLRISQAAYRRLFPNELDKADKALNELSIKFMDEGEYGLAETIASFDLDIPEKLRSQDTEFLYFARVNRAIAQKFSGKDFENGLKGVHWNVFHPKYALCLHALRDEFDEAANLMLSEEIKKEVGQTGLKTWPAFRGFRDTEQFKTTYKILYGVEYVTDPDRNKILYENSSSEELETLETEN